IFQTGERLNRDTGTLFRERYKKLRHETYAKLATRSVDQLRLNRCAKSRLSPRPRRSARSHGSIPTPKSHASSLRWVSTASAQMDGCEMGSVARPLGAPVSLARRLRWRTVGVNCMAANRQDLAPNEARKDRLTPRGEG